MQIIFEKIRDVKSPSRAHINDAGIDFFIPNDFVKTRLHHGESILIPSGIKIKMPENYALVAFNKSGVASKKSIDVMACVVDESYQGEIHISLINNGISYQDIYPGEKIVQFIFLKMNYFELKEGKNIFLEKSIRGKNGFGSTDFKKLEEI